MRRLLDITLVHVRLQDHLKHTAYTYTGPTYIQAASALPFVCIIITKNTFPVWRYAMPTFLY